VYLSRVYKYNFIQDLATFYKFFRAIRNPCTETYRDLRLNQQDSRTLLSPRYIAMLEYLNPVSQEISQEKKLHLCRKKINEPGLRVCKFAIISNILFRRIIDYIEVCRVYCVWNYDLSAVEEEFHLRERDSMLESCIYCLYYFCTG